MAADSQCADGKVARVGAHRPPCAPKAAASDSSASDTDVVLLVMNEGAMKHLLSDKFTLGGDASVAAGPIGRSATAQTDAELQAEILSYSRSHGLFAGISLSGATLRPDGDTNRELYGPEATNREILTSEFKTPAAARNFEKALHRDSAHRD